MSRVRSAIGAVSAVIVAALAGAVPAGAAIADVLDPRQSYDGTERLRYEFGPIEVKPGQNSIASNRS